MFYSFSKTTVFVTGRQEPLDWGQNVSEYENVVVEFTKQSWSEACDVLKTEHGGQKDKIGHSF